MSELVAELVALDKAEEDPDAREDVRLDLRRRPRPSTVRAATGRA